MTWHVDASRLHAYADGTLGRAESSSVEAHVLACAHCRTMLVPVAPAARLAAVWVRVQADADAPRPTHIDRLGLPRVWLTPDL